ncbi:predicted protein [Fibroporia radiculosa]|uniref:Uncharacterized protein n=1 Tax=Fibroporia radiculosa TaxID=599839 RepID=J7S689_9APHY|nr:predicted protein [Fibroporia radiculosa]
MGDGVMRLFWTIQTLQLLVEAEGR